MTKTITFPEYTARRNCPQYWQEDQTGILKEAIAYYNRQICGNPRSLDLNYHQQSMEIVRQYFEHYIIAPVWDMYPGAEGLVDLRASIQPVRSFTELRQWHLNSINAGFDPF